MHRRLVLLTSVAVCAAAIGTASAVADPTAPTHTITDELHGAWSDLPPDGSTPVPGQVYTSVTIDRSDWYQNQPVTDRFTFSSYVADNIGITYTTYAADGSVASYLAYSADNNQGETTKLTAAPDLSWVRLTGTLHVGLWDRVNYIDEGDQPVDLTLTATDHHANYVPSATAVAVDVDLGSGSATGTVTGSLGTIWSGSVPNTRYDRTDHLDES